MKKYDSYITIGELSKLTDVHIKSLRYYNEIGILNPAFIDPETNYRYYSYSQIQLVYSIQFYVDLGIPLKELHKFIDSESKTINFKQQINYGIKLAEEKIKSLENKIDMAKSLIDRIERSETIQNSSSLTKLHIAEKHCWIAPYNGELTQHQYNTLVGNLLLKLKKSGGAPICEMGIIHLYNETAVNKYIFVDIDPSYEDTKNDVHYFYIPAQTFMCREINFDDINNAHLYFPELFKSHFTKIVICSELFVGSQNYTNPTFGLKCSTNNILKNSLC